MSAANLQMQSTRQQILEYLQRHGSGTVKELGALLCLTSTGIRQHLTVLERDNLVEAHEERGRVGRPTLVYSLTEKADSLFPKTYDTLATLLLEELRASEGKQKVHTLLQRVARRLAAPHVQRVQNKPMRDRVRETVAIMEEQGCVADWHEGAGPEGEGRDAAAGEFFIDEYTCPFPKTAEADRAVCALHVEFVRELTGGDTRLARSLMRGERACTYRVRPLVAEEDLLPVSSAG